MTFFVSWPIWAQLMFIIACLAVIVAIFAKYRKYVVEKEEDAAFAARQNRVPTQEEIDKRKKRLEWNPRFGYKALDTMPRIPEIWDVREPLEVFRARQKIPTIRVTEPTTSMATLPEDIYVSTDSVIRGKSGQNGNAANDVAHAYYMHGAKDPDAVDDGQETEAQGAEEEVSTPKKDTTVSETTSPSPESQSTPDSPRTPSEGTGHGSSVTHHLLGELLDNHRMINAAEQGFLRPRGRGSLASGRLEYKTPTRNPVSPVGRNITSSPLSSGKQKGRLLSNEENLADRSGDIGDAFIVPDSYAYEAEPLVSATERELVTSASNQKTVGDPQTLDASENTMETSMDRIASFRNPTEGLDSVLDNASGSMGEDFVGSAMDPFGNPVNSVQQETYSFNHGSADSTMHETDSATSAIQQVLLASEQGQSASNTSSDLPSVHAGSSSAGVASPVFSMVNVGPLPTPVDNPNPHPPQTSNTVGTPSGEKASNVNVRIQAPASVKYRKANSGFAVRSQAYVPHPQTASQSQPPPQSQPAPQFRPTHQFQQDDSLSVFSQPVQSQHPPFAKTKKPKTSSFVEDFTESKTDF